MNTIVHTILTGIGATLIMDLYALILNFFGIKTLDYRFVGRWIGYFPKGKFFHSKIMETPPIPNEQIIGWIAHYSIGIVWAFLLVFVYGENWLGQPRLVPALMIGIVTIIAPFFLMQPAFGFGIAGSDLPDPNRARLMSFITHCIFGIGLYLTALLLTLIRNTH
ncbi:DUF2938 domain-containing protein [Sinomicrobium weinanense]|uniref:DUF2938 domain-containing protein n=1 Tax=Sinomicrobium weinanense TaxID=2842200 RepID=A0A926JSP9_9FLAO|nr:DUF2938 domain-containing protein [Sinomicrobium weinanense]MBC9796783.1 DUF2938 domain-containing protein [Sinomicrobium weinanense]MBU3125530.1 DUF2938 domain-containing protein [Sinomicrobium weinanense]